MKRTDEDHRKSTLEDVKFSIIHYINAEMEYKLDFEFCAIVAGRCKCYKPPLIVDGKMIPDVCYVREFIPHEMQTQKLWKIHDEAQYEKKFQLWSKLLK